MPNQPVTLSEAAVMLLIYENEFEQNNAKLVLLSDKMTSLQKRQAAVRQTISRIRGSLSSARPAETEATQPDEVAPAKILLGQRVAAGAMIGVVTKLGERVAHVEVGSSIYECLTATLRPLPNGQV